MASMLRRRVRLTIGEWRIEDLEVAFDVVFTADAEGNTASFEIYNLSRAKIVEAEALSRETPIDFECGYGDTLNLVYRGLLDFVETDQRSEDVVVRFVGRAGLNARAMATQFNQSFAAGTPVRQVLALLVQTLGIGAGNLPELQAEFNMGGTGRAFTNGAAFSGPAWDSLSEMLSQAGYTVSIVNEELVVLALDGSLKNTAILLSPQTGMIGTPSLALETGDGASTKLLRASTIMIPGLTPGRQVSVESKFVNGLFRVTRSTYRGAWQAGEFGVDIEARRL